jgi:hypothetical protein
MVDRVWNMTPLTSCSESGTFLSFILWTPAEAEPNSAPAAIIELPFILLYVCGVEICVGGGEESEEECGGWMER